MKNALRERIIARLRAISAADRAARSARACALLAEQTEYERSRAILIFLSTPQEIDTAPLAMKAWTDRKRLLAPRVSWDEHEILPIEIRSLTEDIQEARYGIREPVGGSPTPIADIDLVVLPGLAFDGAGTRLGRGRGFFDRFLAQPGFRAIKCALAFEEQFVPAVPADAHDVRIDMLVTDAAVRRFR